MDYTLELVAVAIEGYKSFVKPQTFTLSRPPGLYYVRGDNKVEPWLESNGCGKSNLWDAIVWCWFEKTIRSKKPAGNVTPWSNPRTQTCVTTLFKRNGHEWAICRTRNPRSLTITDLETDEHREVEQSEVYALLGFTEDIFRRTIILGQMEKEHFFDLGPEAQSAMFTEILDLDLWMKAAAKANDKTKDAKKQLDAIQTSLSVLTGRLQQIEVDLAETATQAAEWKKQQAARIEQAREGYEAAAAAIAASEASHPSAPLTAAELDPQLEGDREVLNQKREHFRKLEARSVELLHARNDLAAKFKQLEADNVRLEKASRDLKCPECGQQVTSDHIKDKLKALRPKLKAAKDAATKAETAFAGYSTLNPTGHFQDRITELEADIRFRQDKVNSEALNQNAKQSEWYYKHRKVEQAHAMARSEMETATTATNPHAERLPGLKKRQRDLQREWGDNDEQREAWEIALVDYEFWSDAFKEIRLSIVDEVLLELEVATTSHAEALGAVGWQIKFATERALVSGKTSVGFTTSLFPPNQIAAVPWDNASGGEVQRWRLGGTFGLSEVLLARAGIVCNVEILDEPTAHLSQQGIDDLLEHLTQRAQDFGRAIYLVEHRVLDRGSFAGMITVAKTAEGSIIQE